MVLSWTEFSIVTARVLESLLSLVALVCFRVLVYYVARYKERELLILLKWCSQEIQHGFGGSRKDTFLLG
jgi:hypothetical protein